MQHNAPIYWLTCHAAASLSSDIDDAPLDVSGRCNLLNNITYITSLLC